MAGRGGRASLPKGWTPAAALPSRRWRKKPGSSQRTTQRILAIMAHHHGNRIARKHIGWAITRLAERAVADTGEAASQWRASLLRTNDNAAVAQGLGQLYAAAQEQAARGMNMVMTEKKPAAPDAPLAKAVIDALPNPLIVLDEDEQICLANVAAENYFQASSNVLLRHKLRRPRAILQPGVRCRGPGPQYRRCRQ